jgi:hypothetical protein
MWVRRAFAIVFLLAAACGGDADAGPAPGDYFQQLQRVSETAHIQERGLRRDLQSRLGEAPAGQERMAVVTVFVDQSTRLYEDVVDALRQLHPPQELAAAQRAYLETWRNQLHLMRQVRDAGLPSPVQILKQLELPAFRDAAAETTARCEDLQTAVAANGSQVDLVCDGRPA